jgi:hypothetical protein
MVKLQQQEVATYRAAAVVSCGGLRGLMHGAMWASCAPAALAEPALLPLAGG